MRKTSLSGLTTVAWIFLSLLSACDSRPPEEAEVRHIFETKRATFERIHEMSNEDYSKTTVTRIAPTFTRLEKNWAWPRPESELGISPARWDEYRDLFEQAGLRHGIHRNGEDIHHVLFPVWGEGLADNSHEKGVVFAPTPPTDRQEASQWIRYKPITNNWYYYEWMTW